MFCSNCGKEIDDNAKFCQYCGAKTDNIQNNTINEQNENKINVTKKGLGYFLCFLLVIVIILIFLLGKYSYKSEKNAYENQYSDNTKNIVNPVDNKYIDYSKNLILQYEPHRIYVYKINKEEFNTNDFIKYAQSINSSKNGDATMFFVFDKDIYPNTKGVITGMGATPEMNMPMYTMDVLWKQYPYFYYSDAFGIVEYYCEINGLQQKYYEKNKSLLYNETEFTHKYNLTSPAGFGLSSLNACNPNYKPDNTTIDMEMKLVTIYNVNFAGLFQPKHSDIDTTQQQYKSTIEQEEKNFLANVNSLSNNDIQFNNLLKKYSDIIDKLNENYSDDINADDPYYKNNWIKVMSSEGSDYFAINYNYLYKKYGQYLSPAYNLWLKHLAENESIVEDGGLIVSPDVLRKQIIFLEEFIKQNHNFVLINDVKEHLKWYLRIYLVGLDNSPVFDDWDTKKINPDYKNSYEKFMQENKNSEYYLMVEELYLKAKENNFKWDENFQDWHMNTFTEKYLSE